MTTATPTPMERTLDPREWTVGEEAAWDPDGEQLEYRSSREDRILYSPAFTLEAGRIYVFRLSLTFEGVGGMCFGLQDESMRRSLQIVVCEGDGAAFGQIRARIRRSGTYRLVISRLNERNTRTRIRDLRVEMESICSDEDIAPEHWKEEAKRQWNADHCGHERGAVHEKGTLEYFETVERDRYGPYSPWMPEAIGFDRYAGKEVLEIGGGLGTDLSQFAKAGANVTDLDLAEGHLELARRNIAVRGLAGEFVLGDGEHLPFPDGTFDVVYSFGVIHHTPATEKVIEHIHRVLKPGGEAIVMVYAKHSWNYWYQVVLRQWLLQGMRRTMSIDDVLSAQTEFSPGGARPLVKVYTGRQCRELFRDFSEIRVRKYQLTPGELPLAMRCLAPTRAWGRMMGWNLLVNAIK